MNFNRLWHSDSDVKERIAGVEAFDYSNTDAVERFEGIHPIVMQPRIDALNWQFTFDPSQSPLKLKEKLSRFIEMLTGKRIGEYKNYKNIGSV